MTTRRHFLAANLIGAAGLAVAPPALHSTLAQDGGSSGSGAPLRSHRDFWNDWPAFLTAKANEARKSRLAALARIRSKEQASQRAAEVRSKLWELLGGEPEKTPLQAQITGRLDGGAYRIENILYESFPGVHVTANLYLPAAGKPPYPTILFPVGHAMNGKAYRNYQLFCQSMARMGFVVLTYDPFGQGERLQYIHPQTGRSFFDATGEHSQAGRPMVLSGDNFALYCAWDGIRGIDYLVSRPEVDPTRLGCAGQSGGGTMTMYLSALEPRLKASAVSEGNTEDVAEVFFDPPGSTDDAEQNLPGSLPLGIDRGDLLLSFAPRPLLLCYTVHDEGVTYTPAYEEATKDIYRQLQRIYKLSGSEDHVSLYASCLPHGLDSFNRTQIYRWFHRWLNHSGTAMEEAAFDEFPEERLHVTRTGQVADSLSGRTVIQLNTDRARAWMAKSPFRGMRLSAPEVRSKAQETLSHALALPGRRTPLRSTTLRRGERRGVAIEAFQFESEPGMRVPGWFLTPPSSVPRKRPTVLYLAEDCGDSVVAEPGSLDQLLASGYAVCAITLRGLGLTMPRLPRGGPLYYVKGSVPVLERYAWTSLVLGLPVAGQRVWDASRALDYLHSRPDVDASELRVLGAGGAAIPALLLAFLDSRVRSLLVDGMLVSYAALVESKTYTLALDWFVPGLLRSFDLPQLAAGLSPRSCWVVNSRNPDGDPMEEAAVKAAYAEGQAASLSAGLRLIHTSGRDVQKTYLSWLEEA